MIELDILLNYLIELDFFTKSFIEQRIRNYGVDKVLENQFKSLDCSQLTSDGRRVQQTTGYAYKNELSQTLYIIQNYKKDDEELYTKLLELHQSNLKFEEDNPPEVSTWKEKKKRTKREPKEKKESAAERKLKAKALKLSTLKLNIKSKFDNAN